MLQKQRCRKDERQYMAKKKIIEIIEEISAGYLVASGLELYHAEFVKEGRDWFLRVYIDKLSAEEDVYISTDDCEKVSRFLSDELDRLDPIEQNYYLEVSSPGMDRTLMTPQHYEKYAGRLVEVKLYQGIDGKKTFTGILEGMIDDNVCIKDENDKKWMFPLAQVAKTSLAVVF